MIREKITYRVELVTLKHILRVFLDTFMKIHELHNIVHIVLNFSVGMCAGRRTCVRALVSRVFVIFECVLECCCSSDFIVI